MGPWCAYEIIMSVDSCRCCKWIAHISRLALRRKVGLLAAGLPRDRHVDCRPSSGKSMYPEKSCTTNLAEKVSVLVRCLLPRRQPRYCCFTSRMPRTQHCSYLFGLVKNDHMKKPSAIHKALANYATYPK